MTVLDSFILGKCCLCISEASDSDVIKLSDIMHNKHNILIRDENYAFQNFFHFYRLCKSCGWNYIFYNEQKCIFDAGVHIPVDVKKAYSIEFCLQDYEMSNTMKPGDKIVLLENFYKIGFVHEPFIVDAMIHQAGNIFTYVQDCTHHEGWIYVSENNFVWDKRWFRVEKEFDVTQEEILKFLDEVMSES